MSCPDCPTFKARYGYPCPYCCTDIQRCELDQILDAQLTEAFTDKRDRIVTPMARQPRVGR